MVHTTSPQRNERKHLFCHYVSVPRLKHKFRFERKLFFVALCKQDVCSVVALRVSRMRELFSPIGNRWELHIQKA